MSETQWTGDDERYYSEQEEYPDPWDEDEYEGFGEWYDDTYGEWGKE